ncbi:MAG: hypothetical protein ACRD4U_10145 [Candidatus Acidiferrales bacterium]
MRKEVVLSIALIGLMALASHAQPGDEVKPEVAAKVRAAAEKYVKQETAVKGGFFLRDAATGQVRDLRFDYVHNGVDLTPENEYRVCVDFVDPSQNQLDVDFDLKPSASGEFEVTRIKVHKVKSGEKKESQ